MACLSRADLQAVLSFTAGLCDAAPAAARIDQWIVKRVADLAGADVVGYTRVGGSRHLLQQAEFPGPPSTPTEHEWELLKAQNPYCRYVALTGDEYYSARRLSDVVDMRAFVRTELYEVMGAGLPHDMQTRMPAGPGTHWLLELARSGRNFSQREVRIVDSLRPALIAYESYRALAEKIGQLRSIGPDASDAAHLSKRENQVLDLVAHGASNAEIAERLWISPATVKKHLENVYLKLKVGSRTAALARSGRSSGSSVTR